MHFKKEFFFFILFFTFIPVPLFEDSPGLTIQRFETFGDSFEILFWLRIEAYAL